ncbi:MAG: hypothetical protein ABIR83_14890 [Nakamurella sp.]
MKLLIRAVRRITFAENALETLDTVSDIPLPAVPRFLLVTSPF